MRISHWLNVPVLIILIMSGLQIFNAHPALYWGDRSDRDRPLLSMRPVQTDRGEIKGVTTILGHQFDTTGVLGYLQWHEPRLSGLGDHPERQMAGDGAAVAPVLCLALCDQWADFHGLCQASRHPTGDEAKRYNVLQKLAYAGILFIVAPLIVLTGLVMSPTIDTAFPWILTIFGGRQAARTLHFVACFSFVGFILIHISQVILTGFFNNVRSMVTGWFAVTHEGVRHEA